MNGTDCGIPSVSILVAMVKQSSGTDVLTDFGPLEI